MNVLRLVSAIRRRGLNGRRVSAGAGYLFIILRVVFCVVSGGSCRRLETGDFICRPFRLQTCGTYGGVRLFSVDVCSLSAKFVLRPLGPVLPRLVPRRKTETAVRWFVVVRQRLPLWQVCFLPSLVLQRRVRRKAESAKRMACFPFDPGLSRANGLLLSASVFRRLLCLVGLCLPKVKRFMLIRMPPCEAPSSGFPRCSVNCVSSVHRVSGEVTARYAAGHPASERRRDVIV